MLATRSASFTKSQESLIRASSPTNVPRAARIHVHRESFPTRAAFDTSYSRALLTSVQEGEQEHTFRLYRPDDVLAFSLRDRGCPGFAAAVDAAERRGFASVLRLTGGRAAVFHRETLAFAWSAPVAESPSEVGRRFEESAELIRRALCSLGVDARIGEVPGEYCPGAHSLNARGQRKLVGIGQRRVRGASHVGGVVVVANAERVREGVGPVYRELGIDAGLDLDATGCVEDEIGETSVESVALAILRELGRSYELVEGAIRPEAVERAERLEARHRPFGGDPAPETLPLAGKALELRSE